MQGNYGICAKNGLYLAKFTAFLPLALILLSCEVAGDEESVEAQPRSVTLDCGPQGFLATELFGALAGKIEWDETQLVCEGMPRPDGGVRLRIAGTVNEQYDLAFIVALPELGRGETGKEYASKITIIEEGVGRFFSNADLASCWTDIDEIRPQNDAETRFEISGSTYCVAPLIEVNGDSDITLGDFSFRGLLDWEAS